MDLNTFSVEDTIFDSHLCLCFPSLNNETIMQFTFSVEDTIFDSHLCLCFPSLNNETVMQFTIQNASGEMFILLQYERIKWLYSS